MHKCYACNNFLVALNDDAKGKKKLSKYAKFQANRQLQAKNNYQITGRHGQKEKKKTILNGIDTFLSFSTNKSYSKKLKDVC